MIAFELILVYRNHEPIPSAPCRRHSGDLCVQDSATVEFTTEYSKFSEPVKTDVIALGPAGPARKPVQFDMNKINSTPRSMLGSSSLSHQPMLSPVRAYEDRVVPASGMFPLLLHPFHYNSVCRNKSIFLLYSTTC
jgi:hypothetical protein